PARPRYDWSQFLSFVLVFLPLAAAAAVWLIVALAVPASTALAGLGVFGSVALGSMAVAAYLNARRIAIKLESVSDVVSQMSAGEVDKRIPTGGRQEIESPAAHPR